MKLFYILFYISTVSSGQFEYVSILIFLSLVLQLTLGILRAMALHLLLAFYHRNGSFGLILIPGFRISALVVSYIAVQVYYIHDSQFA